MLPRKKKKFKSYYVVWKRKIKAQKAAATKAFKSYYLVWKPADGTVYVDKINMV